MNKPETNDHLSRLRRKKKNFKAELSMLSDFIRDWCGIEYEYASSLQRFLEKSSPLSRLEKINHYPLKELIQLLKSHLSSSQLVHLQLSKSLEQISTQEFPKYKWDFKESYEQITEASVMSEKEYRKELTNYAVFLVGSKEKADSYNFLESEQASSMLKVVQEKHFKVQNDIKGIFKKAIFEIEEKIKSTVFDLLNLEQKQLGKIDEEIIIKVFSEETSDQVIEHWLSPKMRAIHIEIDKYLSNQICVSDDFHNYIMKSLENLLQELMQKCENSIEHWEEYMASFIKEVVIKISSVRRNKDFEVKKIELPDVDVMINRNEDFCIAQVTNYLQGVSKPDAIWLSRVFIRINNLVDLQNRLPQLFECLTSSGSSLQESIETLATALSEINDVLAYKIIRGEFSYIFTSLYEPYNISYYIPIMREYFQQIAENVNSQVFTDMLQKSFGYFIDVWKISMIKTSPKNAPDEQTEAIKQDIKNFSIMFEAKQSDGLIKGVPRNVQKEYLQGQFDTIALCINSSEDLLKRFHATSNSSEKRSIALILIVRGDQMILSKIINKGN